MEDRAGQFAGDLVHIGDHQQQTLRGGEGGGQCAGLQCAVDGAGRAAFGLHFDHRGNCSPKILPAFGRPLIRELAHAGRRRDGINGDHFT